MKASVVSFFHSLLPFKYGSKVKSPPADLSATEANSGVNLISTGLAEEITHDVYPEIYFEKPLSTGMGAGISCLVSLLIASGSFFSFFPQEENAIINSSNTMDFRCLIIERIDFTTCNEVTKKTADSF